MKIMLLWAEGQKQRSEWISAFNYIKKSHINEEFDWTPESIEAKIKQTEDNFFCVALYRCLEHEESASLPSKVTASLQANA